MGVAMSSILAGSVTVTSSFIGRDLDMTTAEITWISSAASLSAGAFLLFFGKIADLFGRRLMLIGSVLLFSIFALAAGFAKQPITLDVLNGVLGLFSASSVPPALGLLGVVYKTPCKRRNYAFACFSAGNPIGFAMGALFGGVAATLFHWRASFWLIAIIFFLLAILGFYTVPKDPTAKEHLDLETLKRFDLLGVICVIFGTGMFSAALSLGGNAPNGWSTNYVVASLVLGVLFIVAFILWDLKYQHALVPMQIFKNRNFSLAMAILALGFTAFTPGTFFVALYFQDVWHTSPIMTAVYLLPMFIVGLGINVLAGMILHRVSNKLLMWISTISYTIAFVLLAVNREGYSYWALFFPAQVLIVVAVDLQVNVCTVLTMTSLPQSHQSIAGGILHTIVRLTATIGFGIATALFNGIQRKPTLASHWDNATQPFSAVFWFCVACSALSVFLVPFLTIRTQGGSEDVDQGTHKTNS
ncbi:putative MFS-type transporter [Pseudocercospora fuligena]|uniref:Putative MFS-type transporter n=1 Tax=Pseudocercospora fuligena TaxID=685502 RepID=A0A8H6VLS4_9PEZI|nr:putative MFS-type transporter [Pseudocercospora fuligena]